MPPITRQIIEDYDEPSTNVSVTSGKNYILVVAIDDYTYVPRLYNAVKDAQDFVATLTKHYQFATEQITIIKNNFATQDNIIEQLRKYITLLTEQDNLIIFYSGHGIYDKIFEEGYWVPVDAHFTEGVVEVGDCISNSMIQKSLRRLKARHVVLIADACFAGSLVAERAVGVKRLEEFPSRWVLTAGRNEPVLDGKPGMNSPFMESTLAFFRQNTKDIFSISELGDFVTQAVANNATQIPICTPLRDVGDKNGIFFFRRKKNEESDWANTVKENTLKSYEAYLKAYPNGNYTLEASMAIERFKNPLKAKQGNILYNIPNQMTVGKETKCVVRVAFSEVLVRQGADIQSDTVIKNIRVSNVMSAELMDIEGKAFSIRGINSIEQFVDADIATEWIFYVKGLLRGVHRLLLKVSVTEEINGRERVREIVLEEIVTVSEVPEVRKPTQQVAFKTADYAFSLGSEIGAQGGVPPDVTMGDMGDLDKAVLPPPMPPQPIPARKESTQQTGSEDGFSWQKMAIGGGVVLVFGGTMMMMNQQNDNVLLPTSPTAIVKEQKDTPQIQQKDTKLLLDTQGNKLQIAYNKPQTQPKPITDEAAAGTQPLPKPPTTADVVKPKPIPKKKVVPQTQQTQENKINVVRKGGVEALTDAQILDKIKDDTKALIEFIKTKPKSPMKPEAEKRLKEILKTPIDAEENYWKQVSERNEIGAYEKFLQFFPNGRYAEEAKKRIEALQKK